MRPGFKTFVEDAWQDWVLTQLERIKNGWHIIRETTCGQRILAGFRVAIGLVLLKLVLVIG